MTNSTPMYRFRLEVLVAVIALLATANSARAQEGGGESTEKANVISVFLGGTTEPADRGSQTSFSAGINYERRLTNYIGVGVFAEGAFGDTERSAVVGVPFIFHAFAGVLLVAAPILEFTQVRGAGETETNTGLRMGAAYEFPIDRYAIVPEVYLDFIGNDVVLVFGASFALGF